MLNYDAIIDRNNPLTSDVERKLLLEYAETKSPATANKLAMANLRFIAQVVRRHKHSRIEFNDLMQEGVIGFMDALTRYDLSKGGNLRTFSYEAIRYSLFNAIIAQGDIIKTATTHERRKLFFNLRKFKRSDKKSLTMAEKQEISQKLEVSIYDIEEMEVAQSMVFDSVYDGTDSRTIDEDALVELPSADTLDENTLCKETENKLKHIYSTINGLTERQAEIVKRRWLVDDKVPFRDLADDFGISIERVRQVEKQAFEKIKESAMHLN